MSRPSVAGVEKVESCHKRYKIYRNIYLYIGSHYTYNDIYGISVRKHGTVTLKIDENFQ